MNKFIIIGNVVRDPELSETAQGKKLCKITLAVSRAFDKEKTDFFSCTAWEQKAELIGKYVKKGNKLGIIGRVQLDEKEKDGVKTTYCNVIVDEIEFLTSKNESSETNVATNVATNVSEIKKSVATPIANEDLPF